MERIRQWINLYRRYPHWKRAGVVFIHVPKAAGTTINRALYGRTLGHYSVAELRSAFPLLMQESLVFTVVRNPYERLYSAYRFACAGRTQDMGIRNPEQYRIPEFQTFSRFLNEWLVHQDLRRVDHVFRTQSSYLTVDGKLAVDILCKLEQLEEDVRPVEAKLGRELDLRYSNVTGTAEPLRMSNEMSQTIFTLYRDDFQNLGYAK